MKVATRLQVTAILPVLLAVVVSVILVWLHGRINEVVYRLRSADGIVREAFRLNTATFDFVQRPETGLAEEWKTIHRDLAQLFIREEAESPAEAMVFENLRKSHRQLGEAFEELGVVAARIVPGKGADAGDLKRRDEILHRMWVSCQSLVVSASTLASSGHDHVVGLQDAAYMLIIGIAAVLAGFLAVIALVAGRSVSTGIHRLREATVQLGHGDLDHRVTLRSNDELGELADAFNRMADALEASSSALKEEMTQREQAAESLRKANQELSDALVRLKRAQSEVIQEERLRALKQVTRGVVHDMNDALMPIQGITELLMMYPEQLNDKVQLKEYVSGINDSAKRAGTIVQQLSEFLHPQQREMTRTVSLNQLVKEVVAMTASTWRDMRAAQGMKIDVKSEVIGLTQVELDEPAFREILTQLLLNAADAMSASGTIQLQVRPDGQDLVVEVSDTGEGMTEEVYRRCFEPFFSSRGKGHTGMGLTVVHNAVTRNRGSITVKSATGQGSTFTVRLPMKPVEAQKPKPVRRSASDIRLMIIDDEEWVRAVLKQALGAQGYKVETAGEGREGIDKFRKNPVDLVIVDRALPDTSGDDVAMELKKICKTLPIIMLTGFGDLMVDGGEKPEGVDQVMGKPVSCDEIHATIMKLMTA
jgi:signal transduction histidine kinase